MEAIPRNDGEQYRFDAFCKAVLRNEARNYHRNKKRLLDREKSFSVLSMEELGQLTSVDHYPCEESVFSSYGCDLHIDNELVANALNKIMEKMGLLIHYGNGWGTTDAGAKFSMWHKGVLNSDSWHPELVDEIAKFLKK